MQGEIIVNWRVKECCLIDDFLLKIRELGGLPRQYIYIQPETGEFEVSGSLPGEKEMHEFFRWATTMSRKQQ